MKREVFIKDRTMNSPIKIQFMLSFRHAVLVAKIGQYSESVEGYSFVPFGKSLVKVTYKGHALNKDKRHAVCMKAPYIGQPAKNNIIYL